MNKKIEELEKKLKIKLKNKNLLHRAITHKSANKNNNNEKLEFLGDRVIGLVLSKKLIELYPQENEGILDKRFATLVNRDTCSSIAWKIGLQNYLILGDTKKKIKEDDKKILSDACEALIGAIYIDQGYNFIENFVLQSWNYHLKKSNITILDSKTKLQEYSLKLYKKLPIYKMIYSKGPKHNPTFKVVVSIKGSKQFVGTGNSIQEAEQNSAKNLLKGMKIT